MKKLILILIIVTFFEINFYNIQLFSQNNKEVKLLKRTLVISPVFYINKSYEYKFLADIIRDVLKAKLISTEKFNFINYATIDDEIKNKSFTDNDYNNQKKLIELTLSLGADVLIMSKYSIIKDKINITVDVIDLTTGDTIITSSIHKSIGIEIFDIIDIIAKDIRYKMSKKLNKIDKSVLEKKIEEKYGIIKKEEFNKEKNISLIENELIYKYIGINLGTSYDEVLTVVDNSEFKYKKNKNQIILYGNLSGYKNSKYCIFNFENDKLVDIIILVGYPLQISQETFSFIKKELEEVLGKKDINDTDDKIEWTLKDKKFEFSNMVGAKGYILYSFHYYIENMKKNIDLSTKNITFEKKWFNKAIEVSVGGSFRYNPLQTNSLFKNDTLFHSSYYQTIQFTPTVNFSYYINQNFTLGFTYKIGYGLNFLLYPTTFATEAGYEYWKYLEAFPLFHDFYNELVVSHKIGSPIMKNKIIVEYGAFLSLRFISVNMKYFDKHNLGYDLDEDNPFGEEYKFGSYTYYNQIGFPNYYLISGPTFFLGFERKNKNKNTNFVFGGILNLMFSNLEINKYIRTEENHRDPELDETFNSLLFGINIGIEFRIGYNYLKVLK